jgi:hypothetical protein
MPFQSKAQRRKFYALKNEGKMTQKTIDEWQADTPKDIPERIEKKAFWSGFYKKAGATSSLTGGSGLTGAGKMQVTRTTEVDSEAGTEEGLGRADKEDTRTDKTLLDRDRNPRDYGVGKQGPEFQDESNPHLRY